MRRRPDEDDREERERRHGQVACRRRPSDERRDGSRGAADHDVLGRRALEHAGVHDNVEEVSGQRQHRRQRVHGGGQEDEGSRREREPELERPRRRDPAGCHGPAVRARHRPVEVAVDQMIERAGATARKREARHGGDEAARRRRSTGADDHAAGAGQEKQAHDPRLREGDVVAPGRSHHGRCSHRRASRRSRRREGGDRERHVRCACGRRRRRARRPRRTRPRRASIRAPPSTTSRRCGCTVYAAVASATIGGSATSVSVG